MSFTVNKNTKTGAKPLIGQQLLGVNDDCLIIQDGFVSMSIITGWIGALLFWVIGLPMFLIMTIAPLAPPYGYTDEGIKITGFYESLIHTPFLAHVVYLLVFVILIGGFGFFMSLFLMHLYIRTIKKLSPVVFNRKKQTYSVFSQGELIETPWGQVSGSTKTNRQFSGSLVTSIDMLMLRTSGKRRVAISPSDGIHGNDSNGESHSNFEMTWEYIRHFMEYGPNALNVPAVMPLGFAHLDKQAMYSYNFKHSLKSNSILKIFKSKDTHPASKVFGFIGWIIRVVFFIPNMLADWLWHKLCLRHFKDSKCTPQYSFELCGSDSIITPAEAEKVITAEELEKDELINYAEVKKRLKTSNTL